MGAAKGKSPSENAEMLGMMGPQTGDKGPKLKQEPRRSFCVRCNTFLFSSSSLFSVEEKAQCLVHDHTGSDPDHGGGESKG